MIHPHIKKCFRLYHDAALISAVEVKTMVDAGTLAPLDTIYCSVNNEFYRAKAIAEFRAPKFLMTVATDPFIPSDLEVDDVEVTAIMNGLPENFFTEDYECMPVVEDVL